MATNPRMPDEEQGDRKPLQPVPNTDQLKPKPPGTGIPGVIIGIVVAVVLLAVVIYVLPRLPRNLATAKNAQVAAQPVPGQLQFHGLQVIAGPNDNSFYLDGHVTNTGPHAVTGIVADVKLRGPNEEVLLDVKRPMEGMTEQEGELVSAPFIKDPLKPNHTRPFRLSITRAPDWWNHNIPDVKIVKVSGAGA